MPRGKSYRRSEAAKLRMAERTPLAFPRPQEPSNARSAGRGTGYRHKVLQWPISPFTGRSHKLVIPAKSPDKKFVLVVGASHLRAIVDGFVSMPEGGLSFGFMSTPGACATELRIELERTDLPVTPDLICVTAPSNNLTSSRTVSEAGAEFASLLASASSRCPNIFVLDFVPRLNVDVALQDFMRQEFHRVAARMGIKYISIADHFPMHHRHMWCRDDVHLSDQEGMHLYVQLLWCAAYKQLNPPAPAPKAQPHPKPSLPRVKPTVVVTGEVSTPFRPDPYKWQLVEHGQTRNNPKNLKDCFIPVTPVWFSSAMLVEMDKIVPSNLSTPPTDIRPPVPQTKKNVEPRRVAAPRRTQAKQQTVAPPTTMEVSSKAERTHRARVALPERNQLEHTEPPCGSSSRRMVQPQTVFEDCFIPLTRVKVSSAMLDKPSTSPVGFPETVPQTKKKRKVERQTIAAPQRTLAKQQVVAPSTVVKVPSRATAVMVAAQEASASVEMSKKPPATDGLMDAAKEEAICESDVPICPVVVPVEEVGRRRHYGIQGHKKGGLINPLDCRSSEKMLQDVVVDCLGDDGSNLVWQVRPAVRGSFHQGDERFEYRGLQCAPISVVALVKHTSQSVFSWDSNTLDDVVVLGDELYSCLTGEHLMSQDSNDRAAGGGYLSVPDLPNQFSIDGQQFEVEYDKDYVNGMIGSLDSEEMQALAFTSLLDGLRQTFSKYDQCLFTLYGNTCAIISEDGQYAVVDSHARNAYGMVDAEGRSVIVYFSCLSDLYEHFEKFSQCAAVPSFGSIPPMFEITGVRVKGPRQDCTLSAGVSEAVACREEDFSCTLVEQPPFEPVVCAATNVGEKRKATLVNGTSKRSKRSDCVEEDSDVVFVRDTIITEFDFNPLSEEVALDLCRQLNMESEKREATSSTVGPLGSPCRTEKIVGDGNCFFRAVSQAVSGTQRNHLKIRHAVMKHLESNPDVYSSFVAGSLSDYCKNMGRAGKWATALEIEATADLLGVSVFTYLNDRWFRYSCKSNQLSEQAVYLQNVNGNHYETVVCVKQPQTQTCLGYCHVNASISGKYNLRQHSNKIETNSAGISISNWDCISEYSRKKYKAQKNVHTKNVLHREERKELSKRRYRENKLHMQRVKSLSIRKYKLNKLHRQNVKSSSINKYRSNQAHRQNVKCSSIDKYRSNQAHRQKVKALSIRKYKTNPLHRKNVISSVYFKRQQNKQFDVVMQHFLDKVKDGPDFVCCVCLRLLFKHQVSCCTREQYNINKGIAALAEQCINDHYLHVCNDNCSVPCLHINTRGQLWICSTCDRKIKRGEVPPEYAGNSLMVPAIPTELACLNILEEHLVKLNINFMKLLALPKGGQNGVHGPVTCVPSNIVQTSNLLPRSDMEGSLIRVKLKRKLTYKGYYKNLFVDPWRIKQALLYLKQNNSHYKDVEFNDAWVNDFCREEETDVSGTVSDNPVVDLAEDNDDEGLHDRQQHCMFQDTCLMPVDIGQEVLDQYFDDTLNVAPAEGNSPVKLLSDHANEAKCFPVLFPQGNFTFHSERQHRLTLSRYFNNRILHADGRFAQSIDYIFFAQYMSEVEQVVSKVSIALRKGTGSGTSEKVNILQDDESLKKLLEFDNGYRFLKPIRGTPAFWQGAQSDLLACVRQLGVPTWFCSFSSADLRWQNLLTSILKQEGRTETAEQLEWADRCELLRRNPVTAARMFDFRWHCFLREVLMSSAHPIGKIKDYFYRVEFQQRGSPHVHCLFWVENAPLIGKNTDKEVVDFIDKYVTCELPSDDDALLDIVTSVQQHSKRHSKTCKKKNTVCRFNFPRPVSTRTFISRKPEVDKSELKCKCDPTAIVCSCFIPAQGMKEHATKILSNVKMALSDENCKFDSVEQLFSSLGINQDTYETAYMHLHRNTHIVFKRQVNEVWINQYSKKLLKCWNANLDVSFVVDAYATVVYIVSYLLKSEREMGLLLGNAQREAKKDGNVSAKEALKSLGTVYLHNRDVSAQEAVYRLTNLHLKECSRKVEFIPTGDNVVRMSLPLSVLRQRAAAGNVDSDDLWMTSCVDRYKNRPNDTTFNDMCLAKFVSEYRVLNKNENSVSKIKLNNGHGFVVKRTRTQPAVVRYARFSKTKHPEKYYQSALQLFLPHRGDVQLSRFSRETFEDVYKTTQVTFSDGSAHSVKLVVDLNRSKFELEAEELENVQNSIDSDGILEDAWCQLCPEQELERLECVEEARQTEQPVEVGEENIPDLAVANEMVSHLEKRSNAISRIDGLALVRSLNDTQLSVFYQIRQWCLDRVNGKNPEPLHVFISGGAGTGKSHLIKAIQYEAMRLLAPACSHPDATCVLLTAPTGIAAYNLQATTIHTTFSIGMDVRLPYTPLGEEKLNSLRAKYRDLRLLIIDEISMVDHNLLSYIHGRLRQIKQSGESPFGNVSVVAVGDFYQLPPVKGKPLYVDGVGSPLWCNLFTVVELRQIMRQKDSMFAEMLNRVRTRSKGTPMLDSDLNLLKSRQTGEVSSALHIFATNKQVNEHNIQQILKSCPDNVEIEAQDFVNDKKTGKLTLIKGHHTKASKTNLAESLLLGKDARVMLSKNVDVADGLVNGVCGTVTHVDFGQDAKFPRKVFVKFDDDRVGSQRRKQSPSLSIDLAGSVGIAPEEERVTTKGGMRRQFPLKLAWACTVHKVQGITVDSAVVSLKKIFAAGQAYVALSRVRSLSGLIIKDFIDKTIYCHEGIKDAIDSMRPFLKENIPRCTFSRPSFSVFYMNVQSLGLHLADVVMSTQLLQPNCIAVTETWLSADSSLDRIQIDGYSFHNCPRSVSYRSTHPALMALQSQQHGGVGIFCANNVASEEINVPHANMECLVYRFNSYDLVLAVIYRPPTYPLSLFRQHLGNFLACLEGLGGTVTVLGDFNDDIFKSSSIAKFVTDRGYVQLVTQPTTEKGTLIDHVYVKTTDYDVEAIIVPTYFSDHEAIVCKFR